MDSAQRSLRSRLGAFAVLAQYDSREINAKARATFRASFADGHTCAVCPPFVMSDGLSGAERERRGEMLRRGHYARLALASSRARKRR